MSYSSQIPEEDLEERILEEIYSLPDENYGSSVKLCSLPFGLPDLIFPMWPRFINGTVCILLNIFLRPVYFAVTACKDPTSLSSPTYYASLLNKLLIIAIMLTMFIDPGFVKRNPNPKLVR